MIPWLNFLSLIPATTVTLLLISIAFLRFYNEQDFTFLGLIANPRIWSNRLTVAVLLAAVLPRQSAVPVFATGVQFFLKRTGQTNTFGVEWDRRNRETDRLAEEAQRRAEEEQRRAEAARAEGDRRAAAEEQAARRATVEIERDLAFLSYLIDPSAENRRRLSEVIVLLGEYRDTLV